jgi:type VI secretion system secreted protein VgrG
MSATAISQDLRLLELTTPLGHNRVVINGLSGKEAISELFQFDLQVLAPNGGNVHMKDLLGKDVSVSFLEDEQGKKRYFHGVVSQISTEPRDSRFEHYHLTVRPWLWLLSLKGGPRIFQNKSSVDVIKAVFDELKHSFPKFSYRTDKVQGEHIPLDYCVQYHESDLNFVSRLMEQEGIYYFFEYEEDNHTLILADSNPDGASKNRILYHEGGFGEREGFISHWEQKLELRSGKYMMRDHHFQLPKSNLEVVEPSKNGGAASLGFYEYPGEYALRFKNPDERLREVAAEGEKLIRVRMQEEEMPGHLFTGSSNRRNLALGQKFSLAKHPKDDGDYIVTRIGYNVLQTPDYISGGQGVAEPYHNQFTCVSANTVIRPVRDTVKPRVYGPQTAVVTVKPGEESWLDKFGRVRVQFHWDREGKEDENSSCWVRVAQSWAGSSWGAHFWPRLRQEVVVEFLEGDPDRPIITGSVYNAANMPPYPLPANYTRSGIITRSSKAGGSSNFNELRFEDKMSQEQIFLNAEKDMDHRVENDHRVFIGANQHLVVKAAQTELIEGNKHEHIKAEHVEKVDSNASREVGGDHKEKIAGKLSLKVGGAQHQTVGSVYTLQAGDEIHLQAGTKVVIEGGMEVSIKGSGGFVDIGPAGVTIQGVMVKINSGGSAGSGTSASPDAPAEPKDPDIADDGSKGTKLS